MRQSMSMEERRREFSENSPCIFPFKQGISSETGSQQTAETEVRQVDRGADDDDFHA
jgi:hypothetical protein